MCISCLFYKESYMLGMHHREACWVTEEAYAWLFVVGKWGSCEAAFPVSIEEFPIPDMAQTAYKRNPSRIPIPWTCEAKVQATSWVDGDMQLESTT